MRVKYVCEKTCGRYLSSKACELAVKWIKMKFVRLVVEFVLILWDLRWKEVIVPCPCADFFAHEIQLPYLLMQWLKIIPCLLLFLPLLNVLAIWWKQFGFSFAIMLWPQKSYVLLLHNELPCLTLCVNEHGCISCIGD